MSSKYGLRFAEAGGLLETDGELLAGRRLHAHTVRLTRVGDLAGDGADVGGGAGVTAVPQRGVDDDPGAGNGGGSQLE
jgi:hypothetical protein